MSLLHDSNFLTLGGEPITGRTPVAVRVVGRGLSDAQKGMIDQAFFRFKNDVKLSITPFVSQRVTLSDGSTMHMVSSYGIDQATIWPVGEAEDEDAAAGIGMRLVGWDGITIPALDPKPIPGYWLIERSDEHDTWKATKFDLLVGANDLWVSASRERWRSALQGVTTVETFEKNEPAGSFVLPNGATLPVFLSTDRKAAGPAGAVPSVLAVSGGKLNLYQRDPTSGSYAVKDSLVISTSPVSLVGVQGNSALAIAGATPKIAYSVKLSPALSIASQHAVEEAGATVFTSASAITYAGSKMIVPGPPSFSPFLNQAHFADAPNIGTRTVYHPISIVFVGDIDAAAYSAELWAAGTPGTAFNFSRPGPYAPDPEVPAIGYEAGDWITGAWTFGEIVGTRINLGPVVIDDANSVYTELHDSESVTDDVPWQGMTHGGALVQVKRSVKTTDHIDGTTTFSLASFTVTKTASRNTVTTWTLPGGAIITATDVATDVYSEDTTVPYPEMLPVSGTVTVSSAVSRTTLYLRHYDADTGCAVFLKEAINGSAVTAWEKLSEREVNGVPLARSSASTPVGDFFYVNGEPVRSFSGTATMSVCVYLGGTLAYEEILASGPCTVGATVYEPKVYRDMQFGFSVSNPKPGPGYWPALTIVSGPSGEFSTVSDVEVDLYQDGLMKRPNHEDFESTIITQVLSGTATTPIDREQHIDWADEWSDTSPAIYPATAAIEGGFSMGVGCAKDARSGAVALEISYAFEVFDAPKNRARILLVSEAGVVRLNDLIKPPTGAKYDFKTDGFLVTV